MSDKRFNYNPESLKRELSPYYITASEQEIYEMLETVGAKDIKELYNHIQDDVLMKETPHIGKRLEYNDLADHLEQISLKNNIKTSFIGDGLKDYKVHEIVPYVCGIRGLTTAYTPYQPERSQGTLYTLWLYSSALSMLTGFEAINASLYERSTCLFEALKTSLKLKRKKSKVLVAENIYPGDWEVIKTLALETELEIILAPIDEKTGLIDQEKLKELIELHHDDLASFAFPQQGHFGALEEVDQLTDICSENDLISIAIIDPALLATSGLKKPSEYGTDSKGVNIIVGEGQHLAIGPNFGGPGIGIFGIRYNDKDKLSIRSTPGRYVGKGIDELGRPALSMILSTREQHIRREKATSNICSNQSFIATIVGASVLAKGETGLKNSIEKARSNALYFLENVKSLSGVNLAFNRPFFNEITLELSCSVDDFIKEASKAGIHTGVDVSARISSNRNLLLISFFDKHEKKDVEKLIHFFKSKFDESGESFEIPTIPTNLLRKEALNLPDFDYEELKTFYNKLGQLNVSPDDNVYPLGSCTMKYNPYINDWAASLKGFTDIHPQSPLEDAQGCLEILFEIQELFKSITGLPGVTTQPVAGAQGELVGIKLFQAYHKDKGEKRDIILIPRSAHGTNPATATMAGFETKGRGENATGIITIEANQNGQIDLEQVKECISLYGRRIAGVMVTNPNTSGIFESEFKQMAEMIHAIDGLVYMDGANMNAIAGWVDLNDLGVDAVHNNLHKTWTIPHGGGGPGDAIVAVSSKLIDYLPGHQIELENEKYFLSRPKKSIGSFHRHFGNFAHKVRAYTYIKALGGEGVKQMSGVAVLASKYLYEKLKSTYPSLPVGTETVPRMHEFIISLDRDTFENIEKSGTVKSQAIAKVGKLFLDFGMHAPTVAFPEVYGLMLEPTESFTKKELDRFIEVVIAIDKLVKQSPEVLKTVPHFTPVRKVDEVGANKLVVLREEIKAIPDLPSDIIPPHELEKMSIEKITEKIISAHQL